MRTCATCSWFGWVTEVNFGAQYIRKRLCTNDKSPRVDIVTMEEDRPSCPFHRER